jgi:PIN domain nuclease of toxin-antitoxin system
LLSDDNNQLYLSMASIWEIAVKVSIGKLNLSQPLETFLANQLETNNVNLLNITLPHAVRVATLPLHHRDPFDRLLVAQSLVEDLPLLSKDDMFDAYGVVRLW